MKFYLIFALFIFFLPGWCNAQTWQQMDEFPGTQRDDGASFVIGSKAYCGTGNLPSGVGTIDFYEFDMAGDTWLAIAAMPPGEERQYACGFADENYGYIFGGYNSGNFFNDLWQYDPVANSWTEKTPLPATGRSASVHFVIGDTAYIVCGKTAGAYAINEVWAYNLVNDTWTQKNDFPFGNRWRACGTSSLTHGYLALGKDETLSYPKGLYEYNPQTDTWSVLEDFPMPGRSHAKMVFFDNDLLLLTGWDSLGDSHNDMWRYDIVLNSWDQLASIPSTGRRAGMCFSNNVYLYYSTGINQTHTRLKETWKNINPTELKDVHTKTGFSLYPNPAHDIVNINLENIEQEIQSVLIYDSSGKLLSTFDLPVMGGNIEIDLSDVAPGLYSIEIQTATANTIKKLVVF